MAAAEIGQKFRFCVMCPTADFDSDYNLVGFESLLIYENKTMANRESLSRTAFQTH